MHNKESYSYLQDISHSHIIRDPLWKTIILNKELAPLISSPSMQRLHRIRQLGPTYLIYPSATHTRFAHSIGVYHIAKLIILNLLPQEYCPSLSITQVNAFLAAALLHDIGHFPYTHSLKELPLPDHELLSAEIIINELTPLLETQQIDPVLTAAIICPTRYKVTPEHQQAIKLFSQLLSGPMDPDKLDYLCRDAFFTGVPYGIQDIYFAITQIVVDKDKNIDFKSLMPIENILFSKYMMYRSVYWHKKVRSATAMIKSALFYSLENNDLAPQELLSLDDNQFIALYSKIDKPYMQLVASVQQGILFQEILKYDYNDNFEPLIMLKRRTLLEQEIASILQVPYIVIDIPEQISFEISSRHAPLLTLEQQTIQNFTTHIRNIRLFVPPNILPLSLSNINTIERKLLNIT